MSLPPWRRAPTEPPVPTPRRWVILFTEGHFEAVHSFPTEAERRAFIDGAQTGAGLYAGDGFEALTEEELAEKAGEPYERGRQSLANAKIAAGEGDSE